jgi:mannose-1-phosphate guanylyltransferase
MPPNLHIFIMAGGSGERFWPASRAATPKHLLRLLGEQTLLEQTARRFEGIVPWDRVFVLTNAAQLDATRQAVPFLPADNIVAEPAKRDTAPAAALATAIAKARDPEAIAALFPADATIHETEAFQRQLVDAAAFVARGDAILTFAIPPAFPSTGFGYLRLGSEVETPAGSGICHVEKFVEKPNAEMAQEFFSAGNYGWNAGMFLWKVQTFLEECAIQQPELAAFINGFPLDGQTDAVEEYMTRVFPELPKVSVDYAIMENARSVVAAKAEFDWDDVGSWTALPKHLGKNAQDNTFQGSVVEVGAENNIVVAQSRTVALCGVKDLVVVETADAILVCHRDSVEHIKKLPLTVEFK